MPRRGWAALGSMALVLAASTLFAPPARAAGLPVIPTLDCVDSASRFAFFGYANQNPAAVHISVGANNLIAGAGRPNLGQPVDFAPGVVPDAFAVPERGAPSSAATSPIGSP